MTLREKIMRAIHWLFDPMDSMEMEALREELEFTEMNRDYYRAIVDGSWPNADKIIASTRARRRGESNDADC